MRPRCIELHRVLKKTGSFCYHCDWYASHYLVRKRRKLFRAYRESNTHAMLSLTAAQ